MKDSYTFSFPAFIKGEFLTKLAKVNKKLANMANANQVQILSESMETRSILKPDARKKVLDTAKLMPVTARYKAGPEDYMEVVFSIVEVSLPIQTKINGYELAGTINIQGDVKTIFSLNDEVNLSEVDVKLCHHCNTRRSRKALHVFTEEATGNHVAIGSTCVHDYIGLDIDKVLHTFFNFYKEEDLYGSRGMNSAWGFPVANLANAVRVAYAISPNYKKVDPYSGYDYESTKQLVDRIHEVLFHPNQFNMGDHDHFNELLTKAPKVGSLLVDTYKGMDAKASNFNSNVVETLFYTNEDGSRVLRDFIVGKARGIFIWACFDALKKANQVEVQTKVEDNTKPSDYIGKVGERVQVSGTVKFIRDCETSFGTSRLLVVKGNDGNEVKTFTTSQGCWDLKVGSSVSIKGTVSNHETYKGTKSTMVKRASFS